MKNESFKTQMFRFVDVLPCLNSNAEVASHLKEYFAGDDKELPSIFNVGVGIGALAPGLLALRGSLPRSLNLRVRRRDDKKTTNHQKCYCS